MYTYKSGPNDRSSLSAKMVPKCLGFELSWVRFVRELIKIQLKDKNHCKILPCTIYVHKVQFKLLLINQQQSQIIDTHKSASQHLP